jgi:hypothetical protein
MTMHSQSGSMASGVVAGRQFVSMRTPAATTTSPGSSGDDGI